ncbi:ATP-binding cassette domain-containing protein [Calothrix sp. 336/3]|uniref:ATP-binding cassette domain-containing protein n=1 Tax=Calothrix sp. 336/3 TaxID=1337936 RepID=UPI0004E467D6|nr:ATP-binding cassette domain-containing protein [Calothrix sp. 336/3]AKG22932.1 maltooligosyl trehalose synthase [Calothrix sp. 336/3]
MNNNSVSTTIVGVLGNHPQIVLNNQGMTLTFELKCPWHVLGRDPQQAAPEGLKVPEDWVVVSRCQACFRKIGNDYYVYDGNGQIPSSNRLFINNTLVTPKEGYRLQDHDEIKIGQNPRNWVTLTYFDPNASKNPTIPKQRSLSLKNRSVMLGRGAEANLELDAPTVSRCHAIIDRNDKGKYVLTDKSTNGVFVNRQKVTNSIVLEPGAIVQIGPYTFVLQGDELVLFDQGDNIRLDAIDILRFVKNKNKQQITLLNNISLAIEPGQFVALVGGSGAGKSTLLKALLGIEPSNSGTVYLNGDNLRSNFNIYRTLIGYVPQHDIVHTNLRVREVLYYAAKLRLPPDIDVNKIVEETLEKVELSERQDTLVKNLSGGQLKRVSIGVELLADPKLFFLDEPTSGLDPGLDKKMMQLLRRLADDGRTVILVTHATTNITLCDRLVFLGRGGNLCYFGPPNDATRFFQINSGDFADIYIKLETPTSVEQEATRFGQSPYYKEYISDRLIEVKAEQPTAPQKVKRSLFQQLSILTQRYIKLIQRDQVYLGLSLLTAPVGIGLILLAIQGKTPWSGLADIDNASLARKVLFVFTCASLWVGFASSLQEIVKESAVYLRERLVNLGLFAYLGSKVLTLGGLAAIQSLLISLVIILGFQSPANSIAISCASPESCINIPWSLGVFITTFLTIMASISLGLMVSASVKNSTQANSALPLLLLPQIIFAGVLFEMDKIKDKLEVGEIISWLMLSRWSVGGYGILADVNSIIPETAKTAKNAKQLISESAMFSPSWNNLQLNWGILLLHIIIALGVTLWLQKRKDVFK